MHIIPDGAWLHIGVCQVEGGWTVWSVVVPCTNLNICILCMTLGYIQSYKGLLQSNVYVHMSIKQGLGHVAMNWVLYSETFSYFPEILLWETLESNFLKYAWLGWFQAWHPSAGMSLGINTYTISPDICLEQLSSALDLKAAVSSAKRPVAHTTSR